MFTSRMPSVVGLRNNGTRHVSEALAHIRNNGPAGSCAAPAIPPLYGGKQHLPRLRAADLGFAVISHHQPDQLPDDCAAFLHRTHTQLFFLAGAALPAGLHGMSMVPLWRTSHPSAWRDHLIVESELGRMVRTPRYTYARYDARAHRGQLYDLERDPFEPRNHAADPSCARALAHHRELLGAWVQHTNDTMARACLINT